MTPPIRIIIVDDHPMVAEGIEALLEGFDDICVVDVLSDGEQAIAKATELQPDVILMDLNMPKVNGLSATEIILENAPNTKILILSMHDNPEYISTALNHGAMGYILKDVPTEEIKSAIDAVLTGQRYLCSGAKGSLEPLPSDDDRESLTHREQNILLQLAQGHSNKEVANDLNISVRTVETHRRNIKRKLGISTTAGLTKYALEHGVLQGTGIIR